MLDVISKEVFKLSSIVSGILIIVYNKDEKL